MKNIKEKGKNIKGKRKISRQQMAAVCGERAAVAAYGIYAESGFFCLKRSFCMKSRAFHISKSLSLQSEHQDKPQILYILYIIWG